jgi:pantoate--beta-alanine ligase
MKVFSKISDINDYVATLRQHSSTIGFVPTMGALHYGHLSLIERSTNENDVTICSIFINPVQFNNKEDFENYPVQTENDIEMLEQSGVNALFAPSVAEMYPDSVKDKYDFGKLDKVMEGASREGHFQGVAIVVTRLFDIILPSKAYFGEKDFQQLQIIRHLVKSKQIPVEIIACGIIRESDGLAMSSRNLRLTAEERMVAPVVYRTLIKCFELRSTFSVQQLKSFFSEEISKYPVFRLDYFEIADEKTLQPIKNWAESKNPRAFVAVFLGKVRLIDNMKLIL